MTFSGFASGKETIRQPSVLAIATMDTKGEEISFVAACLEACGVSVNTVDVGTSQSPSVEPDISRETVARCHPEGAVAIFDQNDRGKAVREMSRALTEWLSREYARNMFAGVIGVGGSGGTSLISGAMRALPIGVPKMIVSTVASGNTAPYVGCSDITLMYSVVDIAGINMVSRKILGNAAHAMAGMVSREIPSTLNK